MSITLKDFQDYEFMWRSGGFWPSGEPISKNGDKSRFMRDALAVPDAPVLMPRVLSNIVREAIEPLLIGTSLLQRVNYSYGQTVTFPAVGAIVAADIPEMGEYPDQKLQMGGATVTASIGKVGVACSISEEMVRYSQFDVVGMHVRAAGRALARHKELKIFNYLGKMGTRVFDNITPKQSLKGVCTGRSLDGTQNGSLTADDLFDGFGHVMTQGFTPNTILLHPLAWTMWVKDPVLRALALYSGGGSWFAGYSGDPRNRFNPWVAASQGGLGQGTGVNAVKGPDSDKLGETPGGQLPTALSELSQTTTSAPNLPSYFPFPVRVLVSPLVPFDPHRKLTDIYLFDSNELGVLLVDEDVTVDRFDDPHVDIMKLKFRERYGIGILNEGQGIAVFKNVHVVPNEVVLPAQTTLSVATSALANTNPTAKIL